MRPVSSRMRFTPAVIEESSVTSMASGRIPSVVKAWRRSVRRAAP